MNQLDAADTTGANNENLDFVFSDTRVDLLENKVVLAVSEKIQEGSKASGTRECGTIVLGQWRCPGRILLCRNSEKSGD